MDLRKYHEMIKSELLPFFQRIAVRSRLRQLSSCEQSLEIRNTNRYVGSARHMDNWTSIGTVDVLEARSETDDDCGGYGTVFQMVLVNTLSPPSVVLGALKDTYTFEGCACEHDCCGCRSQSVRRIKHIHGNVYAMQLTWSLNY
jgi:hypothetical protein